MASHQDNDWHTGQPRQVGEGVRPSGQPDDTAAQALTAALKLSFRLLTVIMVLVLVAFLLTGVRQVKTDEVGICSRFGRITGTAETGLAYVWPFPVGRLDIIDLSTRELPVNDFWTPDLTKDPSAIRTREKGLRPGRDGALLTGDGNLLHVQLMCKYAVGRGRDPKLNMAQAVLFKINVDDQDLEQTRKQGVPLRSEEVIRSVVCRSAIRAAAMQTAEALRTDTGSFTAAVRDLAQAQLDEMHAGMEIRAVNAVGVSWPLRVLPDVDEVSKAQQKVARDRRAARGYAQSLLSRTAGKGYEVLIGELSPQDEPDLVRRYARACRDGDNELADELMARITELLAGEYDDTQDHPGLIPMYAQARQEGLEELAAKLLAKIDNVLLDTATGRAQTIIQQAQSDRTAMVEPIKGRLSQFRQMLPQYRQASDLTIARLWADTRDAILSTAAAEKFYVNEGDGTVVVRINRDPAAARALQRQLLEQEKNEDEE